MTKISIKEASKKAWELGKQNILILVGLTSIIGLISWILEIWWRGIDKAVSNGQMSILVFFIVAYVITMLISMLAQIGYIKILFKIYDGEEIDPRDIFGHHDRLWNFIVFSFLYGLIVLAGTILFIVPGIILAIKYGYASYFVIDKNMKPTEALKESARITYGYKWKLAYFGFFIILINILGALFFGVGFLFTLPFSTLASIHIFRFLCKDVKTQLELPLNEENSPSE